LKSQPADELQKSGLHAGYQFGDSTQREIAVSLEYAAYSLTQPDLGSSILPKPELSYFNSQRKTPERPYTHRIKRAYF
jgi:hypothetical protein